MVASSQASRVSDQAHLDPKHYLIGIPDPLKRIDTTAVAKHITVKVDGELAAETNVAVLLTESGQPEVYYIPATSIKDWGAIEKSSLRTACPYKGEAW